MPEDQSPPISGCLRYHESLPASAFPTYNIPQEDWNHAQALLKYPPQVIVFIIRELLSHQLRSSHSTHASSSSLDLSFHATSYPVSTSVTASSSSAPSLTFDHDNLESLLLNDEVGASGTTGSPVEEQRNVETADGTLNRQYPVSLPHTQPLVIEGPKQQENRWFCVFDEHRGKSFGKRGDWKKHMNNFHEPGKKAWRCPTQDCFQIFDKASNFCQHHRKEHGYRKSCKHADSAKTRAPIKQAFACGCESCQSLLFSWDEWRDHVAQHMDNGMDISQWQYNTLFRNLLRRPEVHLHWEQLVAKEVYPYKVLARFNWRPRNTGPLKRQLEYMNSSDLLGCATYLALQAYEAGIAVRSARELSDPSALITEPVVMPREFPLAPYAALRAENYSPSVVSDSHSNFRIPSPQFHLLELQNFQSPIQPPPSTLTSTMGGVGINLNAEDLPIFNQLQGDESVPGCYHEFPQSERPQYE
jgi:hypothetical protein